MRLLKRILSIPVLVADTLLCLNAAPTRYVSFAVGKMMDKTTYKLTKYGADQIGITRY